MTETQSPAPPALSANVQGALWMLGSVAGATLMMLSIRLLTPDLHSAMLAFLRSGLGLVLVLPMLWRARATGRPLTFRAWKLHLARGLTIAVALNAGFYAIWHLPLAQATLLFFTAPVFATVLAALALGEKVGHVRWSAIAAGFLGAGVILRPGIGVPEPAMVVALLASLAFAAVLILGRVASRVDGPDAVFVSSVVVPAFATLPMAWPVWQLPVGALAWVLVGALVLASGLRTYADIRAYAVGEAGFLAPFSYLRLVGIGLIGYVWFEETPDAATWTGGAIIIAATLVISLREARLSRGGGAMP